MNDIISSKDINIGKGCPLVLIAGPCVIEDVDTTFDIAKTLKHITEEAGCPFVHYGRSRLPFCLQSIV
jgi:2-dehydro-3-deoxyphosphooctonate aldolase (KDO 8-P synthase)